MGKKTLPTFQAYYVDVPVIVVKRYFVRAATSKENAMERVENFEGIVADEVTEVRRTMQADQHWHAQPSDKVALLDKVDYQLR